MTEREKRRLRDNGVLAEAYPKLVDDLIRRRYSISDEFAILRQKDTKPQEYAEYYEYVESCKAEAKTTLGI